MDRKSTKLANKSKHTFKKYRDIIAAVYLFGSAGTKYEREFSDIDFGIIFKPDAMVGLGKELEIDTALCLALGKDNIDLVNLNRAPIKLRFRAIAEGQLIYEEDYIATSNFLEHTYKLYLDYSYDLQIFEREQTKMLKEVYDG